MATYWEKLKDPRWQKKRLDILSRDEWACCGCGESESTLHVHHGYYAKGRDPWEYEDCTLWTLCEECHTAATDDMADIYRAIGLLAPDQVDSLARALCNVVSICDFPQTLRAIAAMQNAAICDLDAMADAACGGQS